MDLFFVFVFIIIIINSAHAGVRMVDQERHGKETELHSYTSTYTGVMGIPELPDFTAVTRVDKLEVHYYDSNINTRIAKKEWMVTDEFKDFWKDINAYHDEVYIQLKKTFDTFKLKKSYNDTVHTYLWICLCEWDDETGQINRFNHVGFDGENLITLDSEKKIYIVQMQKADNIAVNWNNKTHLLKHSLKFIMDDCVIFLQRYLDYGRTTFNRKVPPKVSLLQKNSSSPVVCHATGFYPAKVNISWRKNGQEYHEYVETGETLPNQDETFQKHVSLRVKKKEWKGNQYSCVVQHKSLIKDIQKILTEDEIISNNKVNNSLPYVFMIGVIIPGAIVIGLIVLKIRKPDNCPNTIRNRSNIALADLSSPSRS